MDTASLPRFPSAISPPAPPTTPTGRGWWMLLQFVTIVAFWVGVYVIREKARAFSEAYRRAEERAKVGKAERGIMGVAVHAAAECEVELWDGKFAPSDTGVGSTGGGVHIWSGIGSSWYRVGPTSLVVSLPGSRRRAPPMEWSRSRMNSLTGHSFDMWLDGRSPTEVYAKEKVLVQAGEQVVACRHQGLKSWLQLARPYLRGRGRNCAKDEQRQPKFGYLQVDLRADARSQDGRARRREAGESLNPSPSGSGTIATFSASAFSFCPSSHPPPPRGRTGRS